MATLGERVRQARRAAGLSQMELGERVGANQGTVSSWERDETAPRLAHLKAIAETTGYALDWLQTGEGTPEAPLVPLGGEAALAGFLATFPGDRLLIVRAVIQGLVTARQPIPAWLTELHNQYLPPTLSAEEVARIAAETAARQRGTRPDGDRRAG